MSGLPLSGKAPTTDHGENSNNSPHSRGNQIGDGTDGRLSQTRGPKRRHCSIKMHDNVEHQTQDTPHWHEPQITVEVIHVAGLAHQDKRRENLAEVDVVGLKGGVS